MILHPKEPLDVFSPFYAVVLNHEAGAGQRVKWSPVHRAWLRNRDYARHFREPWREEPGESFGHPDSPYDDELATSLSLAQTVLSPAKGSFYCEYCFRIEAQAHFIAPNVYGEPELYCVQVPAFGVVESRGGSGQVKHWGSPFGCQSVEHHISTGGYGRRFEAGPMAAYVYGLPLPADEVITREWCSRCVGRAFNVRNNAAASDADKSEWAHDRSRTHVGHLSRRLADYYSE